MPSPTTLQLAATILFACAILHTFFVKVFEDMAHKYPKGSVGENVFHFLGEVEAVFGIWAFIFIVIYACIEGFAVFDASHKHVISGAVHYLESKINYTEPAFVFVIMCMAGTRPVIRLAQNCISAFAKLIPLPGKMSFYISALILGPLLGSFITEPAAMTVTALILLQGYYTQGISDKFKYATIGLLFVNVSIGGTLTHFAAPPVLMVAGKWGWGIAHMSTHFGYKAAICVVLCTLITAFRFKDELQGDFTADQDDGKLAPPVWVYLSHLIFLGLVVWMAHHMVIFLAIFLFFLGFATVTQQYQDKLKLKESLLVGFFLAGLVTLGTMQDWWLKPVLGSMNDIALFVGSTGLTAFTDNAALTYLGGLVPLSESAKYYLVAGAVTGGGLTVIANAPNPAGFGILKGSFGEAGISPAKLALSAAFPTIMALLFYGFLPPKF